MTIFKVGDKVRCLDVEGIGGPPSLVVGETYTVREVSLDGSIIKVDGHIGWWTARRFGRKDTNPKDLVGVRKAPVSTVPAPIVFELGLGMLEGARKYGRHNYRVIGVAASTYYDAARRHLDAWWEGEDIDPDSGLSHLIKAMASIAVARDAEMRNKFTDDRPPKSSDGWLAELNKLAAKIIDAHPDPKAPHTEKSL